MLRQPHLRRAFSAVLVIVGAILIFLAPGNVWIGAAVAALGIVIELIAFWLARSSDDRK